jgi:hypothetical protein
MPKLSLIPALGLSKQGIHTYLFSTRHWIRVSIVGVLLCFSLALCSVQADASKVRYYNTDSFLVTIDTSHNYLLALETFDRILVRSPRYLKIPLHQVGYLRAEVRQAIEHSDYKPGAAPAKFVGIDGFFNHAQYAEHMRTLDFSVGDRKFSVLLPNT